MRTLIRPISQRTQPLYHTARTPPVRIFYYNSPVNLAQDHLLRKPELIIKSATLIASLGFIGDPFTPAFGAKAFHVAVPLNCKIPKLITSLESILATLVFCDSQRIKTRNFASFSVPTSILLISAWEKWVGKAEFGEIDPFLATLGVPDARLAVSAFWASTGAIFGEISVCADRAKKA